MWMLTGNSCVRAVGIVSSILVIRMLGLQGTGIQATVLAVHAFVGPIASLNAADGITHFVSAAGSERRTEQLSIFLGMRRLVGAVSGAVALILALFSPIVLGRFFGIAEYWWALAITAPAIAFLALGGLQSAMLNALGEFRVSALLLAITGVTQAIVLVLAVAFAGLAGFCLGYLISAAISYAIGNVILQSTPGFSLGAVHQPPFRETWRIVVVYCAPSFAASTAIGAFTTYCIGLLSSLPGGTAQIGQYSGANRFAAPILFLTASFALAALPLLTGALRSTQRSSQSSTHILLTHVSLVVAVCILVGAPAYIFAPELMALLGHEFAGSEAVLRALLAATAVQAIAHVALNYLAAQRRMYRTLVVSLVATLVAALFAPSLIRGHGPVGLAWSQMTLWGGVFICALVAAWSPNRIRLGRSN